MAEQNVLGYELWFSRQTETDHLVVSVFRVEVTGQKLHVGSWESGPFDPVSDTVRRATASLRLDMEMFAAQYS